MMAIEGKHTLLDLLEYSVDIANFSLQFQRLYPFIKLICLDRHQAHHSLLVSNVDHFNKIKLALIIVNTHLQVTARHRL